MGPSSKLIEYLPTVNQGFGILLLVSEQQNVCLNTFLHSFFGKLQTSLNCHLLPLPEKGVPRDKLKQSSHQVVSNKRYDIYTSV